MVLTARTMRRDRIAARPKVASIKVTALTLVCPYCDIPIDATVNETEWPQEDAITCTYSGCGALVEIPPESQLSGLFRTVSGKRRESPTKANT
jgi:hypothetical protein